MAGRAANPQGRKLRNINNMPNRKYLPSINFSVPFARWSHFCVSIDWTKLQKERLFKATMTYLEKVHILHQNSIILVVGTVASNKFWSSRSFFDAIENAPL
jgi:hypothetical protein